MITSAGECNSDSNTGKSMLLGASWAADVQLVPEENWYENLICTSRRPDSEKIKNNLHVQQEWLWRNKYQAGWQQQAFQTSQCPSYPTWSDQNDKTQEFREIRDS